MAFLKNSIILISILILSIFNSYATIDSIDYPYNNQILVSPTIQLQFTQTGATSCNYSINNVHNYSISCAGEQIRLPQVDGNYSILVNDESITNKGVNVILALPSAITIIVFMIFFLIILAAMLITFINIILRFTKFDTDFMDVIYAFLVYLGNLVLYYFNLEYLGNLLINNITEMFIYIFAFTHIFVPLVALLVSIFVQKFRSQFKTKKGGGDMYA